MALDHDVIYDKKDDRSPGAWRGYTKGFTVETHALVFMVNKKSWVKGNGSVRKKK